MRERRERWRSIRPGTALDLCMMALGIGPGDEVITTPLTFVCTATTVMARGARVVFADIDPRTLNLDPDAVERRLNERTRAVIPVHFAGLACEVDRFQKLAEKHGLSVVYDAAHAVGTKFGKTPVGGFGKASCYSFQSNKNLTTLGEGGAVTTDDIELAETVRQMKTFGFIYGKPNRVVRVGFNYRMTKPQLAAGLSQLRKIDEMIGKETGQFRTDERGTAEHRGDHPCARNRRRSRRPDARCSSRFPESGFRAGRFGRRHSETNGGSGPLGIIRRSGVGR